MKKLLLSIFGFITLGLLNFGSCDEVFRVTYTTFYGDIMCITGGTLRNQKNLSSSDPSFTLSDTATWSTVFNADFNFINGDFCIPIINGHTYLFNSNTYSSIYVYFVYISSSSCPSQLQSCQSELSVLSGNYNDCQLGLGITTSDLNYCTNLLNTCQSDLLDCQNSSGSSCPTIDTQYCMINGLCPSVSGSGSSNIYIYSDNQYTPLNSANNIFVNLPSYVGYNYSYSNGGNDLDITVGYVIDTGYIDGIITTQNYKPTSEDFTELVGMLAPYSKILIFCVFMFIIWAWIKKPFKSKKL